MSNHIYRFGSFRIDPARRELWCNGELLPMQPKVFDSLAYLIDHRDRAVGRDELIAAVWGKTDLADNILDQIIGRARHAVGDTGSRQRAIRTVPRFGYSWVAPVEVVDMELLAPEHDVAVLVDDHPGIGPQREEARPPPAKVPLDNTARGRPWRWLLSALAALAVAALVWILAGRETAPPIPVHDESALVLPVMVTGDESPSWIRLGVMDLIAERLRAAGQAVVPSDTTVALARSFANSDRDLDTPTIETLAATAKSNLIIEAEAHAMEGRWRVTLRVIHGYPKPLAAQANADDVLDAARAAADRLAQSLGFAPAPIGPASTGEQALATLRQQIIAATLSNRYDEVRDLIAHAAPELQADPEIRYHAAYADMRTGRFKLARPAFETLIETLDPGREPVLLARALTGLATLHFYQGDDAFAEQRYDDVITLLEGNGAHDARQVLGTALSGRGGLKTFQGLQAAALVDYARARVALESVADQLGLAKLDNNIGVLHGLVGRSSEALPYFVRVADFARTFDIPDLELRARDSQMDEHLMLLDPGSALAQESRIRELLARTEEVPLKVVTELNLSETLTANGLLDQSERLLGQALATDVESRNVQEYQQTYGVALEAWNALLRGKLVLAEERAKSALARSWAMSGPVAPAIAWLVLLRAQIGLQAPDKLAQTIAGASAWAASAHDPVVDFHLLLMQAQYAAAIGDTALARQRYETAMKFAESQRVPLLLLRVVAPYTAYLIRENDLAHATVVAGHIAGWAKQDYRASLVRLRLYHALGDPTAWRLALDRSRSLAGQRRTPAELLVAPRRPFRLAPESGLASESEPGR